MFGRATGLDGRGPRRAAWQPRARGACCRAAFPQPLAPPTVVVGVGLAGFCGFGRTPFRDKL